MRVAHPTTLLGPTPPSPLGATARDSSSFAGGDFDDCLSIVDRLLPGTVSVQGATVSQTFSSLEQLMGCGSTAPKPFCCLKETDLVSSVLGKALPPQKATDGSAVSVDPVQWGGR